MARIVSLGSALQDIYLIDRDDFASAEVAGQSIFGQLVIGTKVDIDKVAFEVGGGGTNAAVSFARSGHETIFMGNLAHDAAGEAVMACLDEENIDSSYVEFLRGKTGCSVVMLDAKNGERTILTHRGVSGKFNNLSASDLELIAPDWLYATSLRGDMDTLLSFFETAHALGAKVMFNPGELEIKQLPKLVGLLEDVDVLLVNKREAAKIVPGVLLTELLVHLATYCETVIITDGEMGSIATDHQEVYRLGVYEQVRMRDATGAGDAFGAGFLAAFTKEPVKAKAKVSHFAHALQFAAANAASVVQKYGAKAGILTGSEDLHPMPIQKITDLQL